MTPEQKLLLNCMADFCNGRTTSEPDTAIDTKELFRLADEQSLASVVYIQCREWLKDPPDFHRTFLNSVSESANRKYLLQEITDRFQKEQIPLICIKGSVYRDWWPVPELRSMGDIDLVIRTEDRQKTDEIMLSLGYHKMVDNHAVWTYWIEPFMFELHDHMFYEYLASRFDYRAYFDHIWEKAYHASAFVVENGNLFIPDDNLHFLYLMTHTAKHVINKGSGFRPFLDMVFYARNPKMDWNIIRQELQKTGLLHFTETCFALCERWFRVSMPLPHQELEDRFFESITEKAFRDGTFGLHNEENDRARSAKEIKRSDRQYWMTAAALTVHKLFPPYRNMQLIPWYSWVDGRPWLLPAAWIYRWGYCLVKKRKQGMDLLTEPFARKSDIEKRKNLISSWGL